MFTIYLAAALYWALAVVAGPLHTSSRWILDEQNQRVKFRCTNWAGHMEVNIPEGLQHQSIDYITSWIAANNFNCVRLTYSIDMALAPTTKVADSFAAAGVAPNVNTTAMTALFQSAVSKNPFLANATVLETFAAVISSLESKGIYVILDNHVSKASWCCNFSDGNGWPSESFPYIASNSQYWILQNWLDGLGKMAVFASGHPNVVAMSLRNEMRPIPGVQNLFDNEWYSYVTQGASAIHTANSALLIVIGGIDGATDTSYLRFRPLDTSAWPNRVVWEFHAYTFSVLYGYNKLDCGSTQALMGANAGFLIEQNEPFTGPLWLSEFGVAMTGGSDPNVNSGLTPEDSKYLSCLVQYMQGNDADWGVWALQGSYYVRDSVVNQGESYGLLDPTWADWQNRQFPALLGSMWNVTQGP